MRNEDIFDEEDGYSQARSLKYLQDPNDTIFVLDGNKKGENE